MFRQFSRFFLLGLLSVVGAGCCCVQGMPDSGCSPMGCSSGMCGSGPLMGLASCRGACGEVYVDEWISEPPVVDSCGPNCGCQRCYQPLRSALRLLWGRPYVSCCNTGLCGPSCEGGCDGYSDGGYAGETTFDGEYAGDGYYEDGHGSSHAAPCNCGGSHAAQMHSAPMHSAPMHSAPMHSAPMPAPPLQDVPRPAAPLPGQGAPEPGSVPQVAPEAPALPAPGVAPSSATRRLNPALTRRR